MSFFCTDCSEPRKSLTPCGRCTMCGGARIIDYNPEADCGAKRCRDFGCFGYCTPTVASHQSNTGE